MEHVTIRGKWISAENASFSESVSEDGKKSYMLETMIVPFGKISRNGVQYNKQSVIDTHPMLVTKPLMHNHVLEGANTLPRGEWVHTEIRDDGMYGKAKVFDVEYNKDYIEYLKHTSNPRVSLQITGDAVQKKESDGKYYQEATIKDWLEASTVNVPGFDEAKGSFAVAMAEAFNKETQSTEDTITDEEFFSEVDTIITEADNTFFDVLSESRGDS